MTGAGGAGGLVGGIDGIVGSGGGIGGVPDVDAGGAQGGAGGAANGSSGTGGAGPGGAGMGGAGTGDTGGVSRALVGCADGTREAFTDLAQFPTVAGCSGGWSVPGVLTVMSMTARCLRRGGNDGDSPDGAGCTVEDLCADGWHVCRGATELDTLEVRCQEAGIGAGRNAAPLFFVTRQRGRSATLCTPNDSLPTSVNNLHGCGNFGLAEDGPCSPPLDQQLSHTECDDNPPWGCDDPGNQTDEALVVVKPGPAAGGVLCCHP